MSEWMSLFNPVEEAMQKSLSGDEDDLEAMVHNALEAVPDNWAKVGGVWHHMPDEHFVTIDPIAGDRTTFDSRFGCNWFIEHSLPCRVNGMGECGVQMLWEEHLADDGWWNPGRFKFVLSGSVTDAEGDTRTFDLEPAEKE